MSSSSSRILRPGLVLAALFALSSAASFGGCAQSNGVSSAGTTTSSSSGGGNSNCLGTPPACAGLDDFDCTTTNGCGHIGECQGTAVDCGVLSAAGCLTQGGCSPMSFGNCFGNSQPCFNFGSQAACFQQQGCIWNSNQFSCTGNVTPCAQLPNQTCPTQAGCSLGQGAECGGAPTACNTLMAKDTCGAELGCVWVSQCTGTAKACETFSDDDCRYQPGCSCESCGTSSSSSSSGSTGPCTGQADCDPAQDSCRTGDCINGECIIVPNCQACVKQIDCNPHKNPCLTGNCIDGMCQPIAGCQACTVPADCSMATNKCFSGNCTDGTCELKTMCTSGDGCCPPGCNGKDSDCP
jgi:hypothetical protein